MSLLHILVRKVTWVIKNKKCPTNNQKIIVARMSSQTPNNSLILKSSNDNDEEAYSNDVEDASPSGLGVDAMDSDFRSDDGSAGGHGDDYEGDDGEGGDVIDNDSEQGDDAADVEEDSTSEEGDE